MEKDLVSVIIPTYGGSELLKRAVDSALSQTYKSIEVIVVDDNGLGTENQMLTEKVMKEYSTDERVTYLCHEVNKNGSAARNTGVRASKGEYIAFLDDDDEFNPEKLEKQIRVLKGLGDDYALTYCSIEIFKDDKKIAENHVFEDGDLFEKLLYSRIEISTPTLVVRRTAYDAIGGFDESFKRHQDWEFLVRLADRFKFKSVDYVGFKRYYTFRNNAKNPKTAKKNMEHYLTKMEPYIKKLSKKAQKDVVIYKRLNVAFEFFKAYGMMSFFREYCAIKPGVRGVKFVWRKFFVSILRMAKGEKLRR